MASSQRVGLPILEEPEEEVVGEEEEEEQDDRWVWRRPDGVLQDVTQACSWIMGFRLVGR